MGTTIVGFLWRNNYRLHLRYRTAVSLDRMCLDITKSCLGGTVRTDPVQPAVIKKQKKALFQWNPRIEKIKR